MSDPIDRQTAIDEFYGAKVDEGYFCNEYDIGYNDGIDFAISKLSVLPSIQPDLQEYSVWFRIGEILVDVSKMHITAEEGIEKIRNYLIRMKKPERRKKGKWIRITQGATLEKYMCPFCNRIVESYGAEELLLMRYPFCHCGADMRGEENE